MPPLSFGFQRMFYYVSKIVWSIVNPVSVFGLLVIATCILCFTPLRRLRNVFAGSVITISIIMMAVPFGALINWTVEYRFPAPETLPETIDGVIVLGGSIAPEATRHSGNYSVNASFDRVIAFAELANRFPDAKLVYTGGSHAWTPGIGEAEIVEPLLKRMGVNTDRLVLETKSRNSYQNAAFSRTLLNPGDDETWIIVTSGYHMPRAIGAFRKTGWPDQLIAYPVDLRNAKGEKPPVLLFSHNLIERLKSLSQSLHEVLGMVVYYLTDRSSEWFPAPIESGGIVSP